MAYHLKQTSSSEGTVTKEPNSDRPLLRNTVNEEEKINVILSYDAENM